MLQKPGWPIPFAAAIPLDAAELPFEELLPVPQPGQPFVVSRRVDHDLEENWFRLDWEVSPDSEPTKRVDGYVYNNYGRAAAFMRLLVQSFDSADKLIDQRLEWVSSPVPPMSRSYFSIRRLPTADHYRVSVWSYTIQRRS